MKATAKDLHFKSKELLDSVSRGEEVIITFHGKPCARLVPYDERKKSSKKTKKENKLFGIWKDNKAIAKPDEYVRKLRKGRFSV